jgi:hypothetical protein
MNSERIKEIQMTTAYPDSVSVQQALLKVWNECEHFYRIKKCDYEETKGDWKFERSSGYGGFRCQKCYTWLYENRKLICKCDNNAN